MIQTSGGPNISAQAGGGDDFAHLRNAGGQPIGQRMLTRGDVVQQGRGVENWRCALLAIFLRPGRNS